MAPPIAFLRDRCGEWVDAPNVRLEGRTPAEVCGEESVDLGVFVRLLEVAVLDGVDRLKP
jgi:hypothetical protein